MKKYILIIVVFSLIISSCKDDFFDEVVEIELPEHTPALAVTAHLNNVDTTIGVYVSSSIGILEPNEPADIVDAKVDLYKSGVLFQEDIPHLRDGLYVTEINTPLGNEDAEYELRVEKPGFESIIGVQRMPSQIDIISASYEAEGTVNIDGDRVDEVIIEFQDNANEANYYRVNANLFFEDDGGQEFYYEVGFDSNDPAAKEVNGDLYISDAFFDGQRYELILWSYDLNIQPGLYNNVRLEISLINVSEERYFWENSLINSENAQDNPFAEPAVIFSNIENGYGIFSLEAKGEDFIISL